MFFLTLCSGDTSGRCLPLPELGGITGALLTGSTNPDVLILNLKDLPTGDVPLIIVI